MNAKFLGGMQKFYEQTQTQSFLGELRLYVLQENAKVVRENANVLLANAKFLGGTQEVYVRMLML